MTLTYDLSGNDVVVNTISTGAATPGAAASLIPAFEFATDNQNQLTAAQYAVSHTIYVNDGSISGTYQVAAVTAVFGTASTSGTLQIEVATGTQAIGAGTNQLTAPMSLSGTGNTSVTGTVIASPTTITSGARINLIFAGTVTNMVGCSISVVLKRIS